MKKQIILDYDEYLELVKIKEGQESKGVVSIYDGNRYTRVYFADVAEINKELVFANHKSEEDFIVLQEELTKKFMIGKYNVTAK